MEDESVRYNDDAPVAQRCDDGRMTRFPWHSNTHERFTTMIRPATSADLTAVFNIVNESSPCDLNFQMFAQTYVSQLSSLDRRLGVYEEDGVIMGFVGILCTWQLHAGERIAETKELVVAKAHQDKDIRDQLLSWAEQVARESGCGKITMCSRVEHTDSHRFYEENGYRKTYHRFDKYITLD